MRHRLRVGERRTTYTGKIVYDRKKHPFRLVRIAKIFTEIMQQANEKDIIIGKLGIAPISTIFYFFEQSEVWIKNRGEWDNIFGSWADPYLTQLRLQKATLPPDDFLEVLQSFYGWFDQVMNFVKTGLEWLIKIAPALKFLIDLDIALINLYQFVRTEFPI